MNSKLMLDYIKDTPESIEKLLDVFERKYKKIRLPKVENVVFIGSGSSFNTAQQVSYFYENYLCLNTKVYHPDAFVSINSLNLSKNDTLIIATSETGTSAGTNQALDKAKNEGFRTIALTQVENTPLSEKGDYYFNFCCGIEKCNAKTKGYTNNLILLYLIGTMISKTDFDIKDLENEIRNVEEEIKKVIIQFPDWFKKHRKLVLMNNLLVVGAEPYSGATEEAALKVAETMLIQSSFTSAEEFPHGYHRTINQNRNIFFINNDKYPLKKTVTYFKNKVKNLILINTLGGSDGDINLEPHKYYLETLSIGVVFQLLAYYLPTYLDLDPNRDSNNKYDELINNRLE